MQVLTVCEYLRVLNLSVTLSAVVRPEQRLIQHLWRINIPYRQVANSDTVLAVCFKFEGDILAPNPLMNSSGTP